MFQSSELSEALSRPKGRLRIGSTESDVEDSEVELAAEFLRQRGIKVPETTQAAIIALANNEGLGTGHKTEILDEVPPSPTGMRLDLSVALDAFKLPVGVLHTRLAISPEMSRAVKVLAESSVSPDSVFCAAKLLLKEGAAQGLVSQADVIARAGKYGWAQGNVYQATAIEGQLPPTTVFETLDLVVPEDVLKLPEGMLFVQLIFGMVTRAPVRSKAALAAAVTLIENGDALELLTQAGAITRAEKYRSTTP